MTRRTINGLKPARLTTMSAADRTESDEAHAAADCRWTSGSKFVAPANRLVWANETSPRECPRVRQQWPGLRLAWRDQPLPPSNGWPTHLG